MGAARCVHCGDVHGPHEVCARTGKIAAPISVVGEDDVLVGGVVAERYLVREVLGQGTTGTVFRVENIHFGRPGAMKVLRARYASLEAIQRVFHGEAQTAWSINHACLTEVYDVGALPDGSPYFVMELLEGETLAARIAREPLSLAGAIDVVMQILAVVDVLHTRGLLLRELRPQNVILVERRGCRPLVKIADFGLSRLAPIDKIQEEWDLQQSGPGIHAVSAGSLAIPHYLSPERARSEHGAEPASDVFVAAVLFYEALTRAKPFVSTTFEGLLLQIQQGRPQPLSALRPDLPSALDAVVLRALSSDPRARHASATELQNDLRAAYEGSLAAPIAAVLPIPAPPPRNVKQAQVPRKPTGADGLYFDETETKRKPVDESAIPIVTPPLRDRRPSVAEVDVSIDVQFEASEANHDDRTTPGALSQATRARLVGEDEETETMELTPELRQRIDEMQQREQATKVVEVAPDTRRPGKEEG